MKVSPSNKPCYLDLPKEALDGVLTALEYGDHKHGVGTWRLISDPYAHLDAAMRHIFAMRVNSGARDDESGLLHASHAAANLLIALNQIMRTENTTYAKEQAISQARIQEQAIIGTATVPRDPQAGVDAP